MAVWCCRRSGVVADFATAMRRDDIRLAGHETQANGSKSSQKPAWKSIQSWHDSEYIK
ncbi:MAG: hypothetical protein P1U77_00585 [Rubripirellula sp.]|nr:hypothetical protein [Rubripirellula sp.]